MVESGLALEFTIEAPEVGLRLDACLASRLGISRSLATRLVEEGQALVDGQPRKPSFKLAAGQNVAATEPEVAPPDVLVPQNLPLKIIHADEAIIVIDKPAGLTVHPGAGQSDGTLANALLAHYPELVGLGDELRPGIVHRLDRLTSGVMVVARTPQALEKLTQAFKNHEQRRIYQAICYGQMARPSGRIETLYGRHPKDRKRMSSRVSEGREAITNWRVLKAWEGLSLVELELETGRTHQIRVHLSDSGHPVVGDPLYGGRSRLASIKHAEVRACVGAVERQMLHACLLGLNHPSTGEYLEFCSPLATDMRGLLDYLDEHYA